MTTLTVDANGEVTLRKDLLRRLGARAGQKIEVEPLPNGGAILRTVRKRHDVTEAFGILTPHNKKNISLTLADIDEITQQGWAGEK